MYTPDFLCVTKKEFTQSCTEDAQRHTEKNKNLSIKVVYEGKILFSNNFLFGSHS